MQLYRGMDIGTAKLTPAERRGIPHHLLDVLEPRDEASVARYQAEARAVIDDILQRGAVPILVGGSGLYVSSVLYDFQFPGTDAGDPRAARGRARRDGPGHAAPPAPRGGSRRRPTRSARATAGGWSAPSR